MYAYVLIVKCSGCDFYVIIHIYLSGVKQLSRLKIAIFNKYYVLKSQQHKNILFHWILFKIYYSSKTFNLQCKSLSVNWCDLWDQRALDVISFYHCWLDFMCTFEIVVYRIF